MSVESLVKLTSAHDRAALEAEWLRVFEHADADADNLVAYKAVLAELCRQEQQNVAEELAWEAVEMVASRTSPQLALRIAKPFLLTIGESEELRSQTFALFKNCYDGRAGLSTLLEQSGLSGGRPVRRALRTLDVCLSLEKGDFLSARHSDGAARVEQIDTQPWRIALLTEVGDESLGPVELADRFRRAAPDEFRVMRQFAPERLLTLLHDDPATVVVEICKDRRRSSHQTGGPKTKTLDTDALRSALEPWLPSEADWKRWWTSARQAIKRCPHLKLEGRAPYTIAFIEAPAAPDETLRSEFGKLHDPVAKLQAVENYAGDCKVRGQAISESIVGACVAQLTQRAAKLTSQGAPEAILWWTCAHEVEKLIAQPEMPEQARELFAASSDVTSIFAAIDNRAGSTHRPRLLNLALDWLAQSRPHDWPATLLAALPALPFASCEPAAARLIQAGIGTADFDAVIQQVLGSRPECFEALLWLWQGPPDSEHIPVPPLATLLGRILRAVEEVHRAEHGTKEAQKHRLQKARSALSARSYEQFEKCLDGLDAAMAAALRTQIRRLDALGPKVRGDLLSRLSRRFPPGVSTAPIMPWMQDDVVYVTQDGLKRKQDEIEHLVNVKMRQNADAIGRAAEHGDLSENSEFKFALEERDLLQARLAQMNAEVAAARVISSSDVPTDHAGIGTKISFRRVTDGETYTLALVGPWEADGDAGRYSYKAPLANKILGKKIGDRVEFDHSAARGEYEITALENALLQEPP